MKLKKILVISPDFPFPANHGGRVDIFNRIIALKKLGLTIVLIATVKYIPRSSDLEELYKYCIEVIIVLRKHNMISAFSWIPFQVKSRRMLRLTEIEILKKHEFFACIVEGHYVLGLAKNIYNLLEIRNIYLRVHNNESSYFLNLCLSEKNLIKKAFYFVESIKIQYFEKKIFTSGMISACLHISRDEKKYYLKKFFKSNHFFLPAAISFKEMTPYTSCSKNRTILFVGSLFMPNNVQGIIWYLKHVHDRVVKKHPGVNLVIAGNAKNANLKSIKKIIRKYKNITLITSPSPDLLKKIYKTSNVFINPMLHGAGVKLKTINAIINGLPVVSTSIGNEGTGLIDKKHLYVEDHPYLFASAVSNFICNLNLSRSMVEESQKYIIKNYNQSELLRRILFKC
jgi:glycosyltransferase involved in cell wall biosynthesis